MEISKTGGSDIRSFQFQSGFVIPQQTAGWFGLYGSSSLKMHNINTYLSYGVTDRLDVSAIIPWSKAEMRFNAVCPPNSSATNGMCLITDWDTGVYYDGVEWYEALFFSANSGAKSSSGLGDVTVRAKYQMLKKNREGLAVGLEYRLPTGSPLNLQGSGASGVRPFIAWSRAARVSPHANIGFQYNGSSVNDVRDQVSTVDGSFSNKLQGSKLPNAFTTSIGADYALTKRLNLDADLLERVFSNDGSSAFSATIGTIAGNRHVTTGEPFFTGATSKSTVTVGAKGRLTGRILFSANVQIDATNNGMSYKPSPIATLSYDFGGVSEK
jgi:hypothetical protein